MKREKKDRGERDEFWGGGRVKEFGYRRIIPFTFHASTYEGVRGSD